MAIYSGFTWVYPLNMVIYSGFSHWKRWFSSWIYPLNMVIFHSYVTVYQRVIVPLNENPLKRDMFFHGWNRLKPNERVVSAGFNE